VFREPRFRARIERPPSPNLQRGRSIFNSVELLPNPSAVHSTAPVVHPNAFADKSRAVMVLLRRILSRRNSADSISIKLLREISSTLMDVLWYNAGAGSANAALPRVPFVRARLCKIGVLHNTTPSSLASSRPRRQSFRVSLVSVPRLCQSF
jgi:hypothetical protein